MMQGDITPLTIEEEVELYKLTNYGYFEWIEPDEQVEANFVNSYGRVTVNVSKEPHELVFDFTPLPEPEPIEVQDYKGYYDAMVEEIEG